MKATTETQKEINAETQSPGLPNSQRKGAKAQRRKEVDAELVR